MRGPSSFPPPRLVPYRHQKRPADESIQRGREFLEELSGRRSLRDFSPEPVPRASIELAVRSASTAPSGAHRQPWTFIAIDDPTLKREIRIAAEREERENYEGGRMPPEWLEAVAPFGTTWEKPFIETAPWLVVVFEQTSGRHADGSIRKHYYVKESVGIACGLFVAALHHMGLCTLTHTPSPMRFLSELLGRPDTERPFILFPVGYPANDATVPELERKPLSDVVVWNRGDT